LDIGYPREYVQANVAAFTSGEAVNRLWNARKQQKAFQPNVA